MIKQIFLFLCCFFTFCSGHEMSIQVTDSEQSAQHEPVKMYFATPVDERYFPWMLQLIGSLHHHNFDRIEEIAVFDLGLNQEQKNLIARIAKVKLYSLEMTNPDLLKHFKTDTAGKEARGWYAWKPVVIKQALEMFPYVLYLDGGCVVMRPSDDIFRYLIKKNYFLIRDQEWFVGGRSRLFTIGEMCVQPAQNALQLNTPERSWILDQPGIVAGVQGHTRHMLKEYVLPIYELTKDMKHFADNGSAQLGFGSGRHDQSVFSGYARILGLDLIVPGQEVELHVDDFSCKIHVGDFIGHNPHIFYNCKGQVVMQDKIKWRA